MDLNTARAREAADLFKVPRAFSRLEDATDVDGVLLAIPVGLRESSWEMILERGWNVLCEKPFSTNLAWHPNRFNPDYADIADHR